MMNDDLVLLIGDVALTFLTLGGVGFLIAYSLLAKWWQVREGWWIASTAVALTVLFAYLGAGRVGWLPPLDDGGYRAWVRLAIFLLFAVGLAWVSVLLLLAQVELRRKK